MSDTKAGSELSTEQATSVGGGLSCSPEEIAKLTEDLIQAYENLVDFASHVMGRVSG